MEPSRGSPFHPPGALLAAPLGPSWWLPWGPPGSPGGPLWSSLGVSWSALGGPPKHPQNHHTFELFHSLGGFRGRSGEPLGALLGGLRAALLGPSWRPSWHSPRRSSWGSLADSWGTPRAGFRGGAKTAKTLINTSFFELLEGSKLHPLGAPLSSWGSPGALLERSWGLPGALLKPSWGLLGCPWQRA